MYDIDLGKDFAPNLLAISSLFLLSSNLLACFKIKYDGIVKGYPGCDRIRGSPYLFVTCLFYFCKSG